MNYVHRQRTDAATRGLVYGVLTTTNLVDGDWTNDVVAWAGSGTIDPGFDSVTNSVSTTDQTRSIKLVIRLAE